MSAFAIWGRTRDQLKTIMREDMFSRWIENLKPISLDSGELVVGVDNDFHETWITENYLPLIKQALSVANPDFDIDLKFEIKNDDENSVKTSPKRAAPRLLPKFPLKTRKKSQVIGTMNSKLTFDDFVIGPSNSFAHAAALAVAKSPGRAYNPLFIHGQTGLGKTHLIQAVGHRVLESPNKTVAYISSETLLNEYVDAIQKNQTADFRNKYRHVDVMMIDDIHFLAGKEGLQEEFFHTFNALFESRKQIIMTSDRPPTEIGGLEKRLVSRFEWGMVTELERPDFETRLAILRYKQAEYDNPLSEEIQVFIAQNVQSNVRSLEGAMLRSLNYTQLTSEPLTPDVLNYILRDLLDKERQAELTYEDIQKCVAEFFDIRVADLSNKRRHRSVAMPRQIAMYLCRRLTNGSLPEIGESFDKTHGTVLHACTSIQDRMSIDDTLRQNVRLIVRKLGQDPISLQI